MHSLREELRDLKSYQFRLLSIAAATTGFLLSLTRLRLDTTITVSSPSLYLLPLVIIGPSWFIFFDKAKTITRIVGYYRNLEALLRGDAKAQKSPGWETALGRFRKDSGESVKRVKTEWKNGQNHKRRNLLKNLLNIASLRESQRYWIIAYYTFLTLSAICLWVPIRSQLTSDPTHLIEP